MIHIQKTASQWTSSNPVLTANEIGVESDTKKIKYGDGVTIWSALTYGNISYEETVVQTTIADLQASTNPDYNIVYITDPGMTGFFAMSPTTETGLYGMILVTQDNIAFKRVLTGGALNILWFGADNTGVLDCSALVKLARDYGLVSPSVVNGVWTGNSVYFPRGIYLCSCVNILSDSEFFGDGMGATIIKAKPGGDPSSIFAISTGNYESKSYDFIGNIENVNIHDLTLDFNFINPSTSAHQWYSQFYAIVVAGKAGSDSTKGTIANIRISNVSFTDSSKTPNPGLNTIPSSCINLNTYSLEHLWVQDCISDAETLQFISSYSVNSQIGNTYNIKKVQILNNHVSKPYPNFVDITSQNLAATVIEDILITGNIIDDPYTNVFLFGNVYAGSNPTSISAQQYQNYQMTGNILYFGNFNIYGTPMRTASSLPVILNLQGTTPYLKNVLFANNTIAVDPSYPGGTISFKLNSFSLHRTYTTSPAASFVQPALNANVTIKIPDTSIIAAGTFIAISGGGTYSVVSIIHDIANHQYDVDITLISSTSSPGTTIPTTAIINTVTTSSFNQPAPGATTTMTVPSVAALIAGDIIAVYGGGLYQIISATPSGAVYNVTAQLINLGNFYTPYTPPPNPTPIPAGSVISFLGGTLANITILNNSLSWTNSSGVSSLIRITPSGYVNGLIIKQCNLVNYTQQVGNSYVDNAEFSYNSDFIFAKQAGVINVVLQGNNLLKKAGITPINITNALSAQTNLQEEANVYAAFNVLWDPKSTKTVTTAFQASGGVPGAFLAYNYLRDTTGAGIASLVSGLANNYLPASGNYVTGYPASTSRDIYGSVSFSPNFSSSNFSSTTLIVTGAAIGDFVSLVVPALTAVNPNVIYNAYVSASNVVTVTALKVTTAAVTGLTGVFTVKIIKQ